jgi:hypothetical protein
VAGITSTASLAVFPLANDLTIPATVAAASALALVMVRITSHWVPAESTLTGKVKEVISQG